MGILDNFEAYIEFNESNTNSDHSGLSSKVFQETICKDCTVTENSRN
jgi:hypothetical protein